MFKSSLSSLDILKQDVIHLLAYVFGIAEEALTVPDIDTDMGLMHTLFALEDMRHFKIGRTSNDNLCLYLDKYDIQTHSLANHFRVWEREYKKFVNGEIAKEEYDKWRYTFPKMEADRLQQRMRENRQKEREQETE